MYSGSVFNKMDWVYSTRKMNVMIYKCSESIVFEDIYRSKREQYEISNKKVGKILI
jgi:hypothetical protein